MDCDAALQFYERTFRSHMDTIILPSLCICSAAACFYMKAGTTERIFWSSQALCNHFCCYFMYATLWFLSCWAIASRGW